MINQFDLVVCNSSNNEGIVTRKSFGLSLEISWIVVTADIWTPTLESLILSERYGKSSYIESVQ